MFKTAVSLQLSSRHCLFAKVFFTTNSPDGFCHASRFMGAKINAKTIAMGYWLVVQFHPVEKYEFVNGKN
jgi:hypothetical protein